MLINASQIRKPVVILYADYVLNAEIKRKCNSGSLRMHNGQYC